MILPVPTARLAALCAAGAVIALVLPGTGWWMLGAIAFVLLVLAVIDTFLSPSPKSIAVERELPAAATVGVQTSVQWTVRNHDRRPLRVTVADQLWPSFQASRRRFRATVPARSAITTGATITPTRRGRFPLEYVTVRSESVLGLVSRQHRRRHADTLRVFPAFASKHVAEQRLRRIQMIESGNRSMRRLGGSTDFEQLREYTPDDDLRRLDWAATARAQRPIVRTYRTERNQTIIALLDNGRLMAGTVNGVARCEHAMDAIMALTTVSAHVGDRLGLVAFDRQVRSVVVPAAGPSQLSRVTEAMYRLEPTLVESTYAAVFRYVASRFRRRALIVIFTDLVEAAVHEAIMPALPALGRQHLVMVACVRDPELDSWAAGDHGEMPDVGVAGAVYRQAAAISALEQRRRTLAALRANGAIVIDAVPERLAADVVDGYLALKSAGRL